MYYHNDRPIQYFILVLSGLTAIGLLAWLTLVDHGGRWYLLAGALAVVATPAVITMCYIAHDLTAERGRGLAEMGAAGYVLGEEDAPVSLLWGLVTVPHTRRVWTWIDYDGDGEVDPGELVDRGPTLVFQGRDQAPPLSSLTPGQRGRLLLLWCYDRAAKNLGYGQEYIGGEWTRKQYDEGMKILTHIDLLGGRGRQGVKGELRITPATHGRDWPACRVAALAVYDNHVRDDYVSPIRV